ncbi:MAG: hypothetical protein EA350_15170 [Gemmatimonadales bacterium]|nr:MAG: hypothetical protein EA350_15170 [Gemmatimonadales bacterium]
MSIRSLVPLLVLPVMMAGCLDAIAPEEFEDPPIEAVAFDASLNIDLADFELEDSGIWVRDDEPGEGDPIVMGQEAGFYYTGWVATGQQFDEVSESDGAPPEFALGTPGPIAGLTLGLLGMRLGGERTVLVPPSLGFGWADLVGVPAGSWLVLGIRLVSIDGETEPPAEDPDGSGATS